MIQSSTELVSVALTALFTGLLWVPIILNRLAEMGPWKALRNPEPDVRPKAQWAYRLASAHRNAIENLVVFAPLAISVHILGIANDLTTSAATFCHRPRCPCCDLHFWRAASAHNRLLHRLHRADDQGSAF